MKTYNQRQHRYNELELGKSGVSFNRYGCTTCAILTGHSKLYPNNPIRPYEAVKMFQYTTKKTHPKLQSGLIIWGDSDFDGMNLTHRINGAPSHDLLVEIQNDPNRFMILELDGGSHWVYFSRNTVSWLPWLWVVDSWRHNARIERGMYRPIKKRRVSGYAIFRKDK